MRFSSINERLAGLGGAKWEVHARAKEMARAGREVIRLTIGEPDVPTPERLKDAAYAAMKAGRTGYSDGRGEPVFVVIRGDLQVNEVKVSNALGGRELEPMTDAESSQLPCLRAAR